MAITKLADFLDQLLLSYNTGTDMSVGLTSALVGVLTDKLVFQNGVVQRVPLVNVDVMFAAINQAVEAESTVNITLDPKLTKELMDNFALARDNIHELKVAKDNLHASMATASDLRDQLVQTRNAHERDAIARNDIEVKATNLQAMREFIRDRLPALNAARVEGTNSEAAIDDICRAIDVGCDPTVNKVDEDVAAAPTADSGAFAPGPDAPTPQPKKAKAAKK